MKLSVLQENLSKGLAITSRLTTSRAQLPILGNVLLATDQGRLKISATNLQIGINYWLGAKIETEGAISIPGRVLNELVSSLPAGNLELKVDGNSLCLSSALQKASLVGLPAEEFPQVPTVKKKPAINFPASKLMTAISQVVFAAAQDDGRPALAGVFFQVKGSTLVMVATDGYRLSLKKISDLKELLAVEEFKKGLILPGSTLLELLKIVSASEQEQILGLTLTPSANQAIFSLPEMELITRLIEGEYPDYDKIIPGKGVTEIIIDRELLLNGVRTAAIFARESANIVKFKTQNAKCKISANAPQVGENESVIEVKQTGEENKIAFNARYLMDFLNSTDSDQVSLEMASPLNPGVFKPLSDASYLHIIMPVRIQEES